MHTQKQAGTQLEVSYTCSTSSAQGTVVELELRNQEFLKLESLENRSQEVVELLQP